MNKSFSRLLLAPLVLLLLASFAMTPVAEAAARGGARGGAGQSAQPNNSRADARTNDVRSTSVNNVNVSSSRNVSVNVDQGRNGWDHPVAGAMVVGGAIAAVGSMVSAPPPNCVPVNYGGMVYQQCGGTWYQPQGSQYVVVNPPY